MNLDEKTYFCLNIISDTSKPNHKLGNVAIYHKLVEILLGL